MADLDPCTLLRQADQAWFDLGTGGAVRRVTDQNGETVEYSSASRAGLISLIQTLQAQCTTYQAVALGACQQRRPLRFLF